MRSFGLWIFPQLTMSVEAERRHAVDPKKATRRRR